MSTCLSRYDGDVENDLCLTFALDTEEFGVRTSVELREGGSLTAMPPAAAST